MSLYEPDAWVVIEITNPDKTKETLYKVLAGWNGGYLGADSWRMNSGITHCTEDDFYWYFHGQTGSVYKCIKLGEAMTSLTGSIYSQLKELRKTGWGIKIIHAYGENQVKDKI